LNQFRGVMAARSRYAEVFGRLGRDVACGGTAG
jgi:hypothetical protein